jgi:hypothetical protein
MIAECLEAAGVEQVIWIDDNFARRSRTKCGEAMERALRSLHASSTNRSITIPHFPPFDLSKSEDDVLDDYETAVGGLNDEQLGEAADAIESAAGLEVNRPETRDLTIDEINQLLGAFGAKLTKQSLADWTRDGAERFKAVTRKTLFLIDREFDRENVDFDGLQILKNLVDGEAFCIMFTCHCAENEEEQRRLDYSRMKEIPAHRFSVISKLGANSVVERFTRALRAAFMHRHTGDLAAQLASELKASVDRVTTELTAQSVADIDQAIFENSISEGASELDVLLRIFILHQRRDAREAFKGDRLRNILVEMRRFRGQTAGHLKRDTRISLDRFRLWRQIEVHEDGTIINPIHSPLCCGDIFGCETRDGSTVHRKSFMLLGQPCDLMVRDTGSRTAEAGLFVLLTAESKAEAKETHNAQRYHEIAGVLPVDKVWRVDFLTAFVVDLSVLDYCVFNQDGRVRLSPETVVAEHLLTPGYERVLLDAKKLARKVLSPACKTPPKQLSVGTRGNKYRGKVDGTVIEYPIQRVGRLESTVAHAVLAAWASYQTRAALDHDFARMGAKPEKVETVSPTPAAAGTPTPAAPAQPAGLEGNAAVVKA